jgi:hypothetical protein
MLDVRWARTFSPWQHRARHAWLDGEWHGFDVTLHTQALTDPKRIHRHDADGRFEHFNWVICEYRYFHRSGAPRTFEDRRLVLLLIRLLADALHATVGAQSRSVDLPPLESLARGLTDPEQPVTYRSKDAEQAYPEFRAKVARILDGPLFADAVAEEIERALRPWDLAFA